MAISITANKCNFDSYEVTITSPVEPGGGDHIASIDFGDAAMAYALSIKLEGVAIYGGCSLYFTSAGESYTLEVKSNIQNSNAAPVLKWTYRVHGLYAPVWADVKGEIDIDLNFDNCCASGGTRYHNGSAWVDGSPYMLACATTCSASIPSSASAGWRTIGSGSAASTTLCGACPETTSTSGTFSNPNLNLTGAFTVPANNAAFYAMVISGLVLTATVTTSGMDWVSTDNVGFTVNKVANSYTLTISTKTRGHVESGAARCTNPGCTSVCTLGSSDSCAVGNCARSGVVSVAYDLAALGGCGALMLHAYSVSYRRTFPASNAVYSTMAIMIGVRE